MNKANDNNNTRRTSENCCPGLKKAERPKSVQRIAASLALDSRRKFSGLRSRCITPMLWQCATTETIVRMSSAASFSE